MNHLTTLPATAGQPSPDQAAIIATGEQLAALADQHPEIPSFEGKAGALLADPTKEHTGSELRRLIGGGKTWLACRPYLVTRSPETGSKARGRPAQVYQLDPEKVGLIQQVLAGRKVRKLLDDRQQRLKKQQLSAMKNRVDLMLLTIEHGEDPNTALQLVFGTGLPQLTGPARAA